jgi:beta-glucosidase
MAATWNRDLVMEGARALGEITGTADVDVILGPGVNIKRTPLCGRNFEYYSEDPYLAGELAVAYIEGVQSTHVGTSLKHLAANNQEFDRYQISSEVDERTLRETYLPAFEKAVRRAHPWTVMCAYNRLNGVYCSENQHLLQSVLRDEWGFGGIVVSDW